MFDELSVRYAGCFPRTGFPGHSGIYHESSDLPLGEWRVMANGRNFLLVIESVSPTGEVSGTLNGHVISGDWDGSAVAGKLTFVRNESPTIVQRFTGYLMAFLDEDNQWRIAGTFRTLLAFGEPVEATEDHAGWYGTRPRSDGLKK
ncbi:MAG: hypothetical protein ACK2U0_10365 [Candidatus Promineifilaceae bacterium]|jgi:hypothetical protein